MGEGVHFWTYVRIIVIIVRVACWPEGARHQAFGGGSPTEATKIKVNKKDLREFFRSPFTEVMPGENDE